jgi:hypothetical protein
LSDEENLEALRRLDQFRQWHSLEEKRYCLVCGNLISGRQIQVAGGTRGNGLLRLSCPTEGCNSIPMDWVLPTDEILAKVEKMAAEEREASALKPAAVTIGNGKTVLTDKRTTSSCRDCSSSLCLSSDIPKLSPPIPAGSEPRGGPAGESFWSWPNRSLGSRYLLSVRSCLYPWLLAEDIDCPRGRSCFTDPLCGFLASGKRALDVKHSQPCTFK